MVSERDAIDISKSPDVLRLAEEVRRSNTPRMLRAHNQDVAIMMPVADTKRSKRKWVKTDADYQAFLDSAGSWADVDTEEFKRYIRERRDASSRPPVEL
jgi:hypothetical protein